jgi:hypothetical protein
MRPRLAAALLAAAALAPLDHAQADQCRVVNVDLQPSDKLQMVAWIEDASGNYVDTVFVTDGVGRRGLGNRPGRADFNSGPRWPYGRRTATFPVWANRHGQTYPLVVFQNADENNLSHPFNQSSQEAFFCRPLRRDEPGWDTASCASPIFTDKGKLDTTKSSKYPPRVDIARVEGIDDLAVAMYDQMNNFDAVSTATPAGNLPYTINWPIPDAMALGDYVLWVEVAKEFDHNATYSATAYPAPGGIPWAEYGLPYRGQPSVLYRVPFAVGASASTAATDTYAGYGDPDGLNGNVRPPDATITTNVPGSGGSRLLLRTDGADSFRVRVVARPELDPLDPGTAMDLHAVEVTQNTALVSFAAPGDDGALGKVAGYEIRYRAGEPITEANFATSMPIAQSVIPEEPGSQQDLELTGLLPQTEYYVAVRAFDDCKNTGPMATLKVTTLAQAAGKVDACFVATAAYGTLLANEVANLRSFRDGYLRQTVLGELFVESYYSIGPAFAAAIDPSEPLREAARAVLAPLVDTVKVLKVEE